MRITVLRHPLEIRTITAEDIANPAVVGLIDKAKAAVPHRQLDEVCGHYVPYAIIAITGERPLGLLTVEQVEATGRITLLHVSPRYRRNGIADGMLAWFMQQVQISSCPISVLEAYVPEDALAAQLFLKANGLRATKTIDNYYGRTDAYYFVKEL